MKVVYSILG